MQFALRFYELDNANENFIYNLRTKVATAQVLNGMDESKLDESVDMDLLANILEQFNSKIENPIIY